MLFRSGEPNSFWLGRFTYPISFLTAILQRYSRNKKISIDQLEWKFKVLHTSSIRELQQQSQIPNEGILIRGLYLEGAKWSKKSNTLIRQKPLELISNLPIIHFLPIEKNKKDIKGLFSAPTYIYPIRGIKNNYQSFILSIDLPTEEPSENWIKRGTAILLSLE